MILKGSQRGYGGNLAAHLSNARENDHVEVGDIRGTAAEDLHGALLEIEASAQGTKCQQPFFHVIINPPESANLTREQFAAAFDKIDADMGLADHARAVVFHEKNGREHAHVVYSRMHLSTHYDVGAKVGEERPTPIVKAKNMGFHKMRLREISQDLHKELGIPLPDGLKNSQDRDPLNFGIAEWQQAKRLGEDPRDIKRIIGEAYQFADGAQAFNAALETHAMQLARGDRRGFVVLHHSGETLPLHRFLGAKQKDIRARLGQPEHVQTVDQARATLRAKMTAAAEKRVDDLKAKQRKEQTRMGNAVKRLKTEQQTSRQSLQRQHQTRQKVEAKARADRIRSGLMGLWDRAQLKLGVGKLPREFSAEIEQAKIRDAGEFHALKTEQLTDRRQLQKSIKLMREKHRRERNDMRSNLGYWLTLDRASQRDELDRHKAELKAQQNQGQKGQQRSHRKRDQGLEP
jgi:hypothetical protein